MMKAVDQDFAAAYREAKKLTVFWCPIMELGKAPPPESTEARIETSDHLIKACEELAQNHISEPIKEQLAIIFDPLLPEKNKFKVEIDPGGNTDEAVPSGFYKTQIDNLKSHPETRKFCLDETAEVQISFGLWKRKEDLESADPSLWIPEINICRTYLNKPDQEVFEGHLRTYMTRMGQGEILFKIDGKPWFYKSTGPVPGKPEVNWILRTTTDDDWIFQFRTIVECLNRTYQARYPEIILNGLSSNGLDAIGATIERSAENKALKLSISGYSSYLFRPFFEKILDEDIAVSFKDFSNGNYRTPKYRESLKHSDAILLDVKFNDHSRDVFYGFYSLGSALTGDRCLCGLSYPTHEPIPESIEIANLRSEATDWIKTQYKLDRAKRGMEWNWVLLSSPHFYFAPDPALLADQNTDQVSRKQCEDEARSKAESHWQELMTDFFEGSN